MSGSVTPRENDRRTSGGTGDGRSFESRPPRPRMLVIQLARTGDILQSLMALRAAKQLHPELEIELVVRDAFSEAAKRVPWINRVHELPVEELVDPVLTGMVSERQRLGALARWLSPLIEEPWDFLLNWSYSEASSWLTGVLPARAKFGFSRRADLTMATLDGWSHYIQAVVQSGSHQNIHLTDILTTQLLTALQIHLGDPEAEKTQGAAPPDAFFKIRSAEFEEWLIDEGRLWRDPARKWLGLQLDSGSRTHGWSAEDWADLALRVLRSHPEWNVVLLGERPRDGEAAATILAEVRDCELDEKRLLDATGPVDFDLRASLISRCHWLAVQDGDSIPLASILGTRILHLASPDDRFEETGPYGNGHYVLQPRSSGLRLNPELAYEAWKYASQEWTHRRQSTLRDLVPDHLQGDALSARILRSRIRSTEEGGGVVYASIENDRLNWNDWVSHMTGSLARAWYCGWIPPIAAELSREQLTPEIVRHLRALEEASGVLTKVCEEARASAISLHRSSSALRSERLMSLERKEELQHLGARLFELEKLVDRIGASQPALLPFSRLLKVMMHNLSGEQLSEMGEQAAACFHLLAQGAAHCRQWARRSLDLVKPLAVVGRTPERTVVDAVTAPAPTH